MSPAFAQYWTAETMTDKSGLNVLVSRETVKVATKDMNHKHGTKVSTVD